MDLLSSCHCSCVFYLISLHNTSFIFSLSSIMASVSLGVLSVGMTSMLLKLSLVQRYQKQSALITWLYYKRGRHLAWQTPRLTDTSPKTPRLTDTSPDRHLAWQTPSLTDSLPDRHPSWQTPSLTDTLPDRYPPWQTPSLTDTLPDRHPAWLQTSRLTDTLSDRHPA